jgi:hypothetical protein
MRMTALLDGGTIVIVPLAMIVKMCEFMADEKRVSNVFDLCAEVCR